MNTDCVSLVLIGLRGSGKTTVGRRLADLLDRPLVDLDQVTPGLLGCTSIGQAWSEHGEPAFRGAERDALASVLPLPGRVIALGGGTPTAPGAADLLRAAHRSGSIRTVYLRARPETLRARLAGQNQAHRPSLTGRGVLDEVQAVFEARDALYQALADDVINTDAMCEADVVAYLRALARTSAHGGSASDDSVRDDSTG